MSERYRRLRFPVRAEDLDQFPAYRVDPEPWKALAPLFSAAFERVLFGGAARVLLLKGAPGSGKTAFCRFLAREAPAGSHESGEPNAPDDAASAESTFEREDLFPDEKSTEFNVHSMEPAGTGGTEGLWSSLCGRFSVQLHLVRQKPGFLNGIKQFVSNCQNIPLIVIDDAHAELVLAGLSGEDLSAMRSRSRKAREAELFSRAAGALARLCESELCRAVLLLCSHRGDLLDRIAQELAESHPGLCETAEMPMPGPAERESIVRTNINRLNSVSYWCCLDMSAQPQKARVWEIFHEKTGYAQCFFAVDDAIRSAPRMGRPANRNVITVLALGLSPSRAKYFLELHGIVATDDFIGEHLSISYIRGGWATHLLPNMLIEDKDQAERRRRASLVQSEFALRFFALDVRGAYALLRPPSALDLGERLLEAIEFFPSGGHESKKHKQVYQALSAELASAVFSDAAFAAFREESKKSGAKKRYHQAIALRIGKFQSGFERNPSVKPAFIVTEYSPCSIVSAPSNVHNDLSAALRRHGHSVEIVTVFNENDSALAGDVLAAVDPYAELLASV